MSFAAFLLVVVAAVLHALWNLAAKRASGNLAVFWLGLCFATLALLPAAIALRPDEMPPAGIACVLATSLIHTGYFILLAASYRHGEMSVVYPLARGSGVTGTALVAWTLLGEPVALLGALGILCVTAGILLLGARELGSRSSRSSCLLALLVGVTIVAYSVVDKVGVGLVPPVVYITGLVGGAALFLAPYVLLRCWDGCREAWQTRKLQSATVGLGVVATYLLILFAFQMGSVSYVVAVRELSIAVAAVLSVAVLREPLTLLRGASIGAIVVGVVLVKLA